MEEILHAPGFLGTNANFAADMTLIVSILIAFLFSYGAYLAKKAQKLEGAENVSDTARLQASKLFQKHRVIQTLAALLNILLVLWLMILPYRDFVIRDLGGPRESIFYAMTTIHALVGLFTFIFGNFVVLRGNNLVPSFLKFSNYKPFMKTAYFAYILTTVLGVGVYLTWFIAIAEPPVY